MELKSASGVLAQGKAENDEALRVLDLQMDHLTSQLIEATVRVPGHPNTCA